MEFKGSEGDDSDYCEDAKDEDSRHLVILLILIDSGVYNGKILPKLWCHAFEMICGELSLVRRLFLTLQLLSNVRGYLKLVEMLISLDTNL